MVAVQVGEHHCIQVRDVAPGERADHRLAGPRVDECREGTVGDEDGVALSHVEHADTGRREVAPSHVPGEGEHGGGAPQRGECPSSDARPGREERGHRCREREQCRSLLDAHRHVGAGQVGKRAQHDHERTAHGIAPQEQRRLHGREPDEQGGQKPQHQKNGEERAEKHVCQGRDNRERPEGRTGERQGHKLRHERHGERLLRAREGARDAPSSAHATGERLRQGEKNTQDVTRVRSEGADPADAHHREQIAELTGHGRLDEGHDERHQTCRGERVGAPSRMPRELGRKGHRPGPDRRDRQATEEDEQPGDAHEGQGPRQRAQREPAKEQGEEG